MVRTIEHYLGKAGIFDIVDGFKMKGVPMSRILTAMCTHILMGNNSMSRCSEWLKDPFVRKELGLEGGLSQRTINRAVKLIRDHSDELIVRLWKGLDSRYRFENTDVNIDGSATVEHLIHSLKRVTGLKPLRVWNEATIRGSMMLALLSETAVAMARYELKPRRSKRTADGKIVGSEVRPSTESMVWSLGHLTLTRLVEKGKRKAAHFSNWDEISREVFSNIRADRLGKWMSFG